ncbi:MULTISPECIES: MFS transporter [unclassified Rhizobium]|uniref:MFS transporter n=1 Tax=unclassified Rhizobium TaxID=2613769 RepID=UPI000BE9D028|nr:MULTISPECIES: MFS transporter [unclassified Rhizobium]MDF0664164.1 MFS transporter [Rhizobium sp. BC49]PDS78098.1 MFS transporter [Rhizobium sp. L18]
MTARTFVAFSLTFLLSMFFRTFFAVVGPELSRDLLLSPFQFGVLSSAFFACFAAMQVPVGLLFDRFGCRLPMTVLAICGAVGSAMIATTTSFAQALLGQGLVGVGCAPALMGIYYHYGQALPGQKAPPVAITIAAIGSLGALVSATPLEFLVSTVGWRYAVAASACFMTLASGLLYISVDNDGNDEPPMLDEATRSPSNVGFLIFLSPIFLSASLGIVFRSAWASPYLVEVVEVSSQQAANAFAAVSVAGTLTGFALRLAMKRWSAGSIVGALYGIAIVLTAALAFDPAQNVVVAAVVLSTLYAIGNCHTIALAEAQEHISTRRRGMILGVLNGLGFVGVASFSPIFGMIARSLEPRPAFTAMFAATAAVLTGSLVLYMFRSRIT